MQRPTCTGLRVRSPSDAHIIFFAVSLGMLPIVSRRLDTEERRSIRSGCVYVWEERGPNSEATGLGIERWTDSIRWGPSRVRDEFLFYHEKPQPDVEMGSDSDATSHGQPGPSRGIFREKLIKQTYSVLANTPNGRRKWHLIAYYTHGTATSLRTVDDVPELARLQVPQGQYRSARSSKARSPRDLHFDHLPEVGAESIAYHPPRYHPFPRRHHHHHHNYPLPTTTSIGHGHPMSMTKSMRSPSPVILFEPPAPLTFGVDQYGVNIATPSGSRRSRTISSSTSSSSPTEMGGVGLAPLAYLQNIPHRRRHPLDEKALMSFTRTFS